MNDRCNDAPARQPAAFVRTALACSAALAGISLAGCHPISQAQNAQGVQLYQQGFYQGAIDRFHRAMSTDPNAPDSYYNLAATYHRLGTLNQRPADLQQAESLYNQCLDRDPNHVDCYRGLAVLLAEQGRTSDAGRLLDGWAKRSPTLAEPHVELARLAEEIGNRDQAKQHLQNAVAVDPYNARALAALGRIHEQNGNPEQALANYERSLWQNQRQPEVAARVAALRGVMPSAPVSTPPAPAPVNSQWVRRPTPLYR